MWFSETCWHWHSLYRSMFSGSWRTSPVMWNAAGVSLMGGQHTASWVFCRGEAEPMPGTDRTNQWRAQASSMHANQPVRGAWVEGICRGSLLWIQQQQSHDITWAGKPSGRNLGVGRTGLRDLRLCHAFSDESKAAEWESKSTDMTANTAWFMEEFKTKKLRRKLERYVGKRTHAHTKPPKKQEHSLKNMQAMAKEAFHHFSTIL